MKTIVKAMLGALMLAGASVGLAQPASAYVDVGISFGFGDGTYGFDPCDYYDYYDEPPPWGLPDDYCDYPVWFEPVFFGGSWYRGPIYYRWTHGRRMFWLNGNWREDGWRGPRPARITWNDRGAHVRGYRPGIGFHGGGRDWRDGHHRWPGNDGDRRPWTGSDRPWFGHGDGHPGNNRPWSGDQGDRHGGDRPGNARPSPGNRDGGDRPGNDRPWPGGQGGDGPGNNRPWSGDHGGGSHGGDFGGHGNGNGGFGGSHGSGGPHPGGGSRH